MHPALTIAVFALAVARVTRLVTVDRITEAPRRWLIARLWAPHVYEGEVRRRWPAASGTPAEVRQGQRVVALERFDADGDPPLGAYLVTCPWCVSTYVGAAVAPLWYLLGTSPWLLIPAAALAFSHVTGFLSSKGA